MATILKNANNMGSETNSEWLHIYIFLQYGIILCAKFHAFNTMCTIFPLTSLTISEIWWLKIWNYYVKGQGHNDEKTQSPLG